MAVAGGVGVASVFSGKAWTEQRPTIAVLLILAIVAGEAYGMAATAERLIAGREEAQAPLRGLAEDRARAQRHVDEATRAKADLPVSSPRLERALADKAATDAAVVSKSAERGCVENCRKLLQAQVDAAEQEVARAREEISRKASDAALAIANAKRDLEAMRVPASAAPLADRLGWEPWVLDLVVAALGSVAANGLACFLIVYGAHHQAETHSQAGAHPADHTGTAEPQTTATSRPRPSRAKPSAKAENEALQQAKAFAVARLQPEEAAATDIRAVIKEYTAWCKEAGAKRLPVEEITTALDRLFAIEKSGRCYVLTGVAMRLDGGEEMARLH
jgi:hypothetical protein